MGARGGGARVHELTRIGGRREQKAGFEELKVERGGKNNREN